MISKDLQEALIEQLNKEYHSAYIYLGMSAYCSKEGFNGASNWFLIQYQEEVAHGMKLFKYLEDQDVEIKLPAIDEVKVEYKSLLDVFKKSLAHEQKMTKNLNILSDLAMKDKDHATYSLLQWYVTEQVEEEATVKEIIDHIKLVGDNGYGLYTIDKELSARVFNDPTNQ
ncbi:MULTISPECIES: ferritin [Malaciobacter]|jgi:ferritin|uniref:Ferritin n=2 Tax=Malaciobacter TaxID=2321114 RepID=A0A347TJG1_9BACT|nr:MULTISPECIES: ferritin [Malaciobacter]AXX86739.1 nonheme-containing ferritin [Malaciobacter marinus]PHO10420.1 ferritin [Malaciobacter canalis]PHO12950.1 ferritin [Malaciobacter marinus]PHO15942.1 ferritin [Malaciobacter marinus]PPK61948.1 ferritin [Malaciobacter marinus]